MIKYVLIAVCVIVLLVLIKKRAAKSKIKRMKKKSFNLPDGFTVTAHAGSMGTKANSYESLPVGANNADIIELDVRFDGFTPVLAHTKTNKSSVRLADAFALIAERSELRANLDMKEKDDRLVRVQNLAEAYGILDRVFFTGIEEKYVECVRENSPKIGYFLNVSVQRKKRRNKEYILSLVEKVKNSGAIGINLCKLGASKELVEIFHENGLLVSIWTANSVNDISRILSLAPDNITTRKPDIAKSVTGA